MHLGGILSLSSPPSSAGEVYLLPQVPRQAPVRVGSHSTQCFCFSSRWWGAEKRGGLWFASVLTHALMSCALFPSLGVSPVVSKAVKLAGPFLRLQGKSRLGLAGFLRPNSCSALPFPASRLLPEEGVGMAQGTHS